MSRPPSSKVRCVTAAAAASASFALLLGACSSSDDPKTVDTTTTTEAADESSGTSVPSDLGPGAWGATASSHVDAIGETFDYTCDPDGSPYAVWGAGTYTSDSSVCTAAVQVGLITFEEGGEVTIEMSEGRDIYGAATANGVTSDSYGSWDASFTFPDAPPDSLDFAVDAIGWDTSAGALGIEVGETRTVVCAADGTAGALWGTGTYTSDSSICTAAVHAGLLSTGEGGEVAVTGTEGESAYEGSTANGVTSGDYDSWESSFIVEGVD